MFLNQELFWMINKTIIELSVRIIWRIMEISEGVIRLGTLLDLHKILTQPHLLIVKYVEAPPERYVKGRVQFN